MAKKSLKRPRGNTGLAPSGVQGQRDTVCGYREKKRKWGEHEGDGLQESKERLDKLKRKKRGAGTHVSETGDDGLGAEKMKASKKKKKRKSKGKEVVAPSGRDAQYDVGDSDHDKILASLRAVDWSNVVNTGRKNVIDPKRSLHTSGGKAFCQSFILGPNMKSPTREPSYWTKTNPELTKLLTNLMRRHDPLHEWTNITVNRNFNCKPHRDRGNTGPSYIVGFGEYIGGELNIERIGTHRSNGENPNIGQVSINKSGKGKSGPGDMLEPIGICDKVNIRRRFVKFFGGQQTHWTEPFKGPDRYSCVFYNFPEVHVKATRCTQRVHTDKQARFSIKDEMPPNLANKLDKYKQKLFNGIKRSR
mmetsp:Transcript_6284/g.10779  ORF Transcript_6284/g.10779 Transcript_6284/m.10779 type:complete len:361 (+) Transcript_6284:310-1392(+)|eukprot:CAMPEP_0203760758 /NCGR_PEP_ID=MMETSP0098-20131031/13986_1 /ASSEMBLY_ACC=CAM_ASM_000208 /TAXON_ID=96639 /ORGANISM=" , Strain NY0313808BC1" /LENGTH=360 /DNA_ID=CAMNT_0050654461 /DNA_START=225 /DNA_END=1307 /DNA_ORIENTATION=-